MNINHSRIQKAPQLVLFMYKVSTFSHLSVVRRIWEENIRMDLKEIGIKKRNWVDSAQDRGYWRALVNWELNLKGP